VRGQEGKERVGGEERKGKERGGREEGEGRMRPPNEYPAYATGVGHVT